MWKAVFLTACALAVGSCNALTLDEYKAANPLHAAVCDRNLARVKELVEGAKLISPDAKDGFGRTPLAACLAETCKCVVLETGSDI